APLLRAVRLYKSRWQAMPDEWPPARRVEQVLLTEIDLSRSTSMRLSVGSRWEAFWFEPSAAIGLAICRVLFFGAFLLYYLRINYTELGSLPPHTWRAVWPFTPLGLGLPSASTLDMLQWVWRASLFA